MRGDDDRTDKKSLNLKTEVWGRGKGSKVSERDYALRPGHARDRVRNL